MSFFHYVGKSVSQSLNQIISQSVNHTVTISWSSNQCNILKKHIAARLVNVTMPLNYYLTGLQLVKRDFSNLHEKKLMEMKQEAEIYKQQLELERLRGELQQYRSSFSNLPQLPAIPQDQRQHSLVSAISLLTFIKCCIRLVKAPEVWKHDSLPCDVRVGTSFHLFLRNDILAILAILAILVKGVNKLPFPESILR